MHCLVFTDTDLYSLTKGKAYLANQRWCRFTCLRDQCYDVGCHPCNMINTIRNEGPIQHILVKLINLISTCTII